MTAVRCADRMWLAATPPPEREPDLDWGDALPYDDVWVEPLQPPRAVVDVAVRDGVL